MDASPADQGSLPISPDALLAQLDQWGIEYTLYQHIPLRTVEDAKTVQGNVLPEPHGAAHVKNLYLRDRKKRNYLVTLEQDRDFDLKEFGKQLGVGNLSFGSADRLKEHLGIRPGAVSPLAMINGVIAGVQFYIDAALLNASIIYLHPLMNDRSIAITPDALARFMDRLGIDIKEIA